MTYDDFIKFSNTFGERLVVNKISLTNTHVHFVTFILREEFSLSGVIQVLSGLSLMVLADKFSKKNESCDECCIFFLERGYKSMEIGEYDMNQPLSNHFIFTEKDVNHDGIIGIAVGCSNKGMLVTALGPDDPQKEAETEIEIMIIHNSVELLQTQRN